MDLYLAQLGSRDPRLFAYHLYCVFAVQMYSLVYTHMLERCARVFSFPCQGSYLSVSCVKGIIIPGNTCIGIGKVQDLQQIKGIILWQGKSLVSRVRVSVFMYTPNIPTICNNSGQLYIGFQAPQFMGILQPYTPQSMGIILLY